ncbi:hypothetical protein WK24_27505 [Burkholderia vietnamiensis]|uniref:helix-turn-helix domain-containing protein n=1 Tax=Burkholderia vietnamiensis TaxID=60552 RepID=UPI000770CC99|nr:helix-turn-helix domain-containing protein [Burkholderia vietnamiensis]KVR82477.1 hypothetical protein WK24_27505 [Burkholderia vietnamiensis]
MSKSKPLYLLMQEAILSSDLTMAEKMVFIALKAHYHFEDEEPYYVSHKRLAKESGCSVSTVKRAIERLECDGWVRAGGSGARDGSAQRYHVMIPPRFEQWTDDSRGKVAHDELRVVHHEPGVAHSELGAAHGELQVLKSLKPSDPSEKHTPAVAGEAAASAAAASVVSTTSSAETDASATRDEVPGYLRAFCQASRIGDVDGTFDAFRRYAVRERYRFTGAAWGKPAAEQLFSKFVRIGMARALGAAEEAA